MNQPIRHLPVRNLICLRDPDFKKHEWHAGHISRIKDSFPQEDYEIRQQWKEVGKKAYRIIRDMEHYWGMQLSPTQRHMLYVYIRDELYFSEFSIH